EISVKTGNNARNGGKNSLNRLIRCVCGKKIGPDPRNFNQRVSLGRNDLLIRTFPKVPALAQWLHTALGLRLRYKSSRMMNSFLYDFDVICLLQHHGVAITSDEPVGYSVPIPTRNVFEAVPLQHGYVIWLLQT
ncbi:hypothetical protein ACQ4EF_004881, partial [Escherichia coli]